MLKVKCSVGVVGDFFCFNNEGFFLRNEGYVGKSIDKRWRYGDIGKEIERLKFFGVSYV